jgi:antitoxin component YwqK of YwqJK toxin-antitoxin module
MKKFSFLLVLIFIGSMAVMAQDKAPGVKKVRVMEQKYDQSDNSPEIDMEATYDENGNMTEAVNYKNGKINSKISYKYDSQGNKISETKTDKSGAVVEITEYKYNGTLRTEKVVYDGKKKMLNKKTYEYEMK